MKTVMLMAACGLLAQLAAGASLGTERVGRSYHNHRVRRSSHGGGEDEHPEEKPDPRFYVPDWGRLPRPPRDISHEVEEARLADGNSTSGRLEVKINDEWGTVCSDGFTWESADLFCRQLGFRRAFQVLEDGTYPGGNDPILLDGVRCHAHAPSFEYCCSNQLKVTDCDHSRDVAIECTNNPEFKVPCCDGKDSPRERRRCLQDCMEPDEDDMDDEEDEWCRLPCCPRTDMSGGPGGDKDMSGGGPGGDKDMSGGGPGGDKGMSGGGPGGDRDMSGGPGGNKDMSGGPGPGGDRPDSKDGEEDLPMCPKRPKMREVDVELRLADGPSAMEGRVEIRGEDGQWGSVCDDTANFEAAFAFCRQLGYRGAEGVVDNVYGSGTGPVVLGGLRCLPNAASLGHCCHNEPGVVSSSCSDHSRDLAIRCTNSTEHKASCCDENNMDRRTCRAGCHLPDMKCRKEEKPPKPKCRPCMRPTPPKPKPRGGPDSFPWGRGNGGIVVNVQQNFFGPVALGLPDMMKGMLDGMMGGQGGMGGDGGKQGGMGGDGGRQGDMGGDRGGQGDMGGDRGKQGGDGGGQGGDGGGQGDMDGDEGGPGGMGGWQCPQGRRGKGRGHWGGM